MNQLRIRWWLSALMLTGAFLLVLAHDGVPAVLGQDATPGVATAPAPDWSFVVHGVQDPYAGVLTNPQEPVPGMRYVGADVEVVNASDQPLTFSDNAVYLRDDAGFSYRGGTVAGSEPALQGRTLPAGERTRGWIWFEVPQTATLTEILLVPSAPELRVALNEVGSTSGTTDSSTTSGVTLTPAAIATQPATEPPPSLATEPPAAATSAAPPVATQAPTSVITIESAPPSDAVVSATATPRPAVTATPRPVATATPAIVTSVPTATPPASATGIEPGDAVVIADSDANLRDGPSLDAAVIGTIPLGSELTVTGPAVADADFLWWPVMVLETGEEGYVAAELLTPVDAP